ncbi:DUF2637 domain-containing protein [Streptomyces diastaticus]|uniref:DUF2637 domain-containing protein n=1 Tax=Streptomyces diastaticus TaxID=1956 RepID=UPI00364892FB
MSAERAAGHVVLTRAHRALIGVVVAGAVVIAAIGFAGSYAAVRELALQKGFGTFSHVFPIAVDVGICTLLGLDIALRYLRIPYPLLRQVAWVLTAATIIFNSSVAWPDPLGVGMHAVIPLLFIITVEAARHAIGRIADITADKHTEGVRLTRWLLSPLPSGLLWRRMKLWEIRSYEHAVRLEQERLIYQARLRSRFGRAWRRKAPVESLMPLRLARYGVPLAETAPAGLAAAGIEPALLPPAPATPTRQELERAATPATAEAQEPTPEPARQDLERVTVSAPAPARQEPGAEQEPVAQHSTAAPPAARLPLQDGLSSTGEEADGEGVDVPASRGSEKAETAWVDQWEGELAGDAPRQTPGDSSHARVPAPESSSRPRSFKQSVTGPQSTPAPSYSPERVPEPVAWFGEPSEERAQRTALDVPAKEAGGAGHLRAEGAGVDTGEATARDPDPDPQAEVPPESLTPGEQVEKVTEWLAEAERSGVSLSGAEVARRLKVSARTGQRRVGEAEALLEEWRQVQRRGHLRSVRR